MAGVLVALLLVVGVARAESPTDEALVLGDDLVGFAERGQWVISSDAAMSIQHALQKDTNEGTLSITVAPAVDWFVRENLSLGAAVNVQYVRSGKTNLTRIAAGPRVGYNVEITHLVSFWPRVGLSYAYSSTEDPDLSVERNALAISIFAPLMIHRVAHFFIGFGPFFDSDLGGRYRGMLWGGRLTLGGWM
jgi:hypothetical protein